GRYERSASVVVVNGYSFGRALSAFCFGCLVKGKHLAFCRCTASMRHQAAVPELNRLLQFRSKFDLSIHMCAIVTPRLEVVGVAAGGFTTDQPSFLDESVQRASRPCRSQTS